MTITRKQYEQIPSGLRWLVKALGIKVVPDLVPVKPPPAPLPAPNPPAPMPEPTPTPAPQETPPSAFPADAVPVVGVKPWGNDRIVAALRSVTVKGDSIHLDFDNPHWPDRNENITMTWVAVQVRDGKGVKMGRFEHGRPSNSTRAADTLIGERPGFTVERGDTVAVMAVANILESGRPRERTNNVLVQWR